VFVAVVSGLIITNSSHMHWSVDSCQFLSQTKGEDTGSLGLWVCYKMFRFNITDFLVIKKGLLSCSLYRGRSSESIFLNIRIFAYKKFWAGYGGTHL
jgi:hypothetical protein